MNEQLQAKLLEYLNNGEAFMREQAPEYVKQALEFYAWGAVFSLKCGIALLFGGAICAVVSFLSFETDSEGIGVISATSATAALLFGLILVPCSYSELKKIEIAPKVFLVEKLTRRCSP